MSVPTRYRDRISPNPSCRRHHSGSEHDFPDRRHSGRHMAHAESGVPADVANHECRIPSVPVNEHVPSAHFRRRGGVAAGPETGLTCESESLFPAPSSQILLNWLSCKWHPQLSSEHPSPRCWQRNRSATLKGLSGHAYITIDWRTRPSGTSKASCTDSYRNCDAESCRATRKLHVLAAHAQRAKMRSLQTLKTACAS